MIRTICSQCKTELSRRHTRGRERVVKTVGTCCAAKLGLPAHAAHPLLKRRQGDRRAA